MKEAVVVVRRAVIASFSLYAFLFLCFSIILIQNRNLLQLQLRSPVLSMVQGIVTAALIQLISSDIFFGMDCTEVLWAGNMLLNLHACTGAVRAWSILVMADRQLRAMYRWTLRPRFICAIFTCVLFYTGSVTFVVQRCNFHWFMAHGCFFIIPLWTSVPQVLAIVAVRVCSILRIKNKKILDVLFLKVNDRFGIAFEVKCDILLKLPILLTYLILARLSFQNAKVALMTVISLDGIFTVVLPVLRVISEKKKFASKCDNINCIRQIISHSGHCEMFREHAKKSLCEENVDFCVQIMMFKAAVWASAEDVPSGALLKQALGIVNEYISTNSPSEVNISSHVKSEILLKVDSELFRSLKGDTMLGIFDKAEIEILKLLSDNLLHTFVQS